VVFRAPSSRTKGAVSQSWTWPCVTSGTHNGVFLHLKPAAGNQIGRAGAWCWREGDQRRQAEEEAAGEEKSHAAHRNEDARFGSRFEPIPCSHMFGLGTLSPRAPHCRSDTEKWFTFVQTQIIEALNAFPVVFARIWL
jgi:hypothetical protein